MVRVPNQGNNEVDDTVETPFQSNRNSPRSRNQPQDSSFRPMTPSLFPTPSHSLRNLYQPDLEHSRNDDFNNATTVSGAASPAPSPPPTSAAAAANANAANAKREGKLPQGTRPRRPSVPFARQYLDMLRKMRTFQILASIVVLIVVVAVVVSSIPQIKAPDDIFEVPTADKYGSAALLMVFVAVQWLGLAILLWYSYMPIGSVCRRRRRSPKPNKTGASLPQSPPQQSSRQNSRLQNPSPVPVAAVSPQQHAQASAFGAASMV